MAAKEKLAEPCKDLIIRSLRKNTGKGRPQMPEKTVTQQIKAPIGYRLAMGFALLSGWPQ